MGRRRKKAVVFDDLPQWKPFAGKFQVKLGTDPAPFMVDSHPLLKTAVAKAIAFQELMQLGNEHAAFERESVQFYFNPAEVRATEKIEKGQLKLVPVTDIAKVTSKAEGSNTSSLVTCKGKKLFLEPPARPKGVPTEEEPWKNDMVMCAYWLIKGTSQKAEANLVKKHVTWSDFTFEIYQNDKVLKPHDKLAFFEPEEPLAKKGRK